MKSLLLLLLLASEGVAQVDNQPRSVCVGTSRSDPKAWPAPVSLNPVLLQPWQMAQNPAALRDLALQIPLFINANSPPNRRRLRGHRARG